MSVLDVVEPVVILVMAVLLAIAIMMLFGWRR